MKNKIILTLIILITTSFFSPSLNAQIKREYRGMWISAYVKDWPASPIIASNAEAQKKICNAMLDSLAVNNITTVYYHVRAMCDAMYDSAYEPWSHYVSGKRGLAPPFDPFAYILEEGHKRGLEVYAWINPYRYAKGTERWGESDRDYVNTHPEWLISTEAETVLNPGIPEVKQRLKDVITDIMSKYDIDGIVFDDYFYNQGGILSTEDVDNDLYKEYVKGGGTFSQADWRRENVNAMVREVNEMIKSTKPWVRFGISPAGVAGTAQTSASKYGVKPSPGSDWQYNTIYSDPLCWMSERSVDFMSPQIYWPVNGANDFDALTQWWSYIAKHFNRHFYVSQIVNDEGKHYAFEEYSDEVLLARNYSEDGAPGTVYFRWATVRDAYQKFDGKFIRLPHHLKRTVFQHKALSPAVTWLKADDCGVPASVTYNDGVLSCTPRERTRYVIYAVPNDVSDSDFHKESEYMVGTSYEPTFTLPIDKREGYRHAVAYLDSYGNEYSAVFAGAELKDMKATKIVSPANGAAVQDLFELKWDGVADEYFVEICEDPELTKVVTNVTTDMTVISTATLRLFETGKTYYWRITGRSTNCRNSYSEIYSFTPTMLAITSPVANGIDVPLMPKVEWSSVTGGEKYKIEIAKDLLITDPIISEELPSTEFNVPKYRLSGNTKYYARVTATSGNVVKTSDASPFLTADYTPNVPVVVTPTEGATMFSNSRIHIAAEEGIRRCRVEICASTTFPPRSTYSFNLDNFNFSSDEMSKVKLSSASLVDGKTYYMRARYEYSLSTSETVLYTDFTPTISFVYSTQSGVDDVLTSDIRIVGNQLIIPMAVGDEKINLYSPTGALIEGALGSNISEGYNEINLDNLSSGVYLITINGANVDKALKFVK